MSPAEEQFRKNERVLDAALAAFKASPESASISVREDTGGRTYHYKNQFLSWDCTFVRDRLVDYETHRIRISLNYREPPPSSTDETMSILVISEIFRPGQISQASRKTEYAVRLNDIEQQGLAKVLSSAMANGEHLLAR